MGAISPICHQDPRDNLWNNQKWQQTGGTKGSDIPRGPYLYGLFNTLQGFTRGHLDSKNL